MQKISILAVLLITAIVSFGQTKFPKNVISINGFRNPSIGLEYQRQQVSIHAGYYPTNFTSGVTTEFMKAGVTYWFAPVGKRNTIIILCRRFFFTRDIQRIQK